MSDGIFCGGGIAYFRCLLTQRSRWSIPQEWWRSDKLLTLFNFQWKKSKKIEHKLKTVSKLEFEEAPMQTHRYAERQDGSFQWKKQKMLKVGKAANIEIYSEENVNWPPLYSFRSDRRRLFNLVAVQTKPNSKVNLEQLPNNSFHLCSFYNWYPILIRNLEDLLKKPNSSSMMQPCCRLIMIRYYLFPCTMRIHCHCRLSFRSFGLHCRCGAGAAGRGKDSRRTWRQTSWGRPSLRSLRQAPPDDQ